MVVNCKHANMENLEYGQSGNFNERNSRGREWLGRQNKKNMMKNYASE